MPGIDVDLFDYTGTGEFDDTEIMSLATAAAGFPAVHPLTLFIKGVRARYRFVRIKQAFLRREKFIRCMHDFGTEAGIGEVHHSDQWGCFFRWFWHCFDGVGCRHIIIGSQRVTLGQPCIRMTTDYPRDMVGYGSNVPDPQWPAGAKLALQIVLNYEEGAEQNILHGDPASESFLSEMTNAKPLPGVRHKSMESLYEYGSRAGVWRLLRVFEQRALPVTVFAVGMALQRNPEVVQAMLAGKHEIASHGWRWIDYQSVDEATEREHVDRAVKAIEALVGERPLGWYTGRDSPNTRRLIVEYGGFLYDSDSYADDLPYWESVDGTQHLVIPYTLDCNDMRFVTQGGLSTGDQFFAYLKDAFDVLYREGDTAPKMMSVGLHCRLAGRPGRLGALQKFLDYVQKYQDVWICKRLDIARHWIARHPAGNDTPPPV